jgi:hypothetical protein
MSACDVQASAAIEMYFYGELDADARTSVQRHLAGCRECRSALEELRIIRAALASRPDIAAPPRGDWTGFMSRLDDAIARERPRSLDVLKPLARRRYVTALAMAALLTLVTGGVTLVFEHRRAAHNSRDSMTASPVDAATVTPDAARPDPAADRPPADAFAASSEQHFERSKLVVLGLASKDPREASATDWAFERQLAGTLLGDTRLYKLAAQQRGLTNIARVMSDLEVVLLEASLSNDRDADTLDRIQRLIRKRDLVTKMDVVNTAGL